MTFEEAIRLIHNGKCLLFTGAGFSIGAKNYNSSDPAFKAASKIAKELYTLCGVPEDDQDNDLSRAALWYKETYGSLCIIDYLRHEFEVKEITATQCAFGEFNWRRCYTLNYDEILEKAYKENGKILTTVTPSKNSRDYNSETVCIHLNGAISNLNLDTLETEFKLTSSNYARDYIKHTGWWEIFTDDLIVSDAIFFVGCSLRSDLDLVRLLGGTKTISQRTFFIVSPLESNIDVARLKEFGEVIKIGSEGFIKQLKSLPKPANNIQQRSLYYFTSPRIFSSRPEFRRKDFTDLFVQGRINEHLLFYALKEPDYYPYYIYRDRLDNVVQKIANGQSLFVIHSDLGNGKTLFLKGLSYILSNKGYKVFYITHDSPSAIDELSYICEGNSSPTIIIAENFVDNFSLLQKIKRYRRDHITLLLSERTSAYETSYILLQKITDTEPIDIDLNELTDQEIDKLIKLIDINGLWQTRSRLSLPEKREFIIKNCKRHISQFVIQLVKSSDLEKRYAGIVNVIKNKKDYFEALLYILISTVLQLSIKIQNVIDDLNYDTLNAAFKRNKYIREFIDFDEDEITIKSSILAQYVLRNLLNYSDVEDSIISIFKKLHEKRASSRIRTSLKKLCLYDNLNKILRAYDKNGFNKSVFKIYENIAYLEYNQENPLFWLQFAIARLADEDYPDAKRCFDNAYSYAAKTGFDTFQIDNHYARYLLENASINKSEIDIPMEVFRRAHQILMVKKRGQELKYHNYRIAGHYLDFYNAYVNLLTIPEKLEIFAACNEMIVAMNHYLSLEMASKKDLVEQAKKKLENILQKQVYPITSN